MTKLANDHANSKDNSEYKHIPIESIDEVGAKLNKPVIEKMQDCVNMDIDNNDENDNKFYAKIPINSNKNAKAKSRSKPSSSKKSNRKTKRESTDESDSEKDSGDYVQEKVAKRPVRKVNSKSRSINKKENDEEMNENETKTVTSKISIAPKLNKSGDLRLSESESE